MNQHIILAGAVAFATMTGGCAAHQDSRELMDARAAYQDASTSPGAGRAQADIERAHESLAQAEAASKKDPDSEAAHDWTYIAQRNAHSARAKANALASVDENKAAKAELASLQASQRKALEDTKGQLAKRDAALESERSARAAADQRTSDALSKIAGMKAASSERGLILTLSGSVLFQTGKSTILPAARGRLDEAAAAIKEDGRAVTVVGHTDSTGTNAVNDALSQQRAEAVRTYLVTHGVPADRVRSEGAGESQPIADNATPDGRANNRRVEIILENAKR